MHRGRSSRQTRRPIRSRTNVAARWDLSAASNGNDGAVRTVASNATEPNTPGHRIDTPSSPKPFNVAKVFESKPGEGGAQDRCCTEDGRRNRDEQRHWPTQEPDDRTGESHQCEHPRETTHTGDRIPRLHPTDCRRSGRSGQFRVDASTGFIDMSCFSASLTVALDDRACVRRVD
jgi:hypothetical protein